MIVKKKLPMNTFITYFFNQYLKSIESLDLNKIDSLALDLKKIKKKRGRVFFLGVGGSAGNATCSQ